MLALAERYFEAIARARRDTDAVDILLNLSTELGFRSAFLIEYSDNLQAAVHILDTNGDRAGWWNDYIAQGLREGPSEIHGLLDRGPVLRLDKTRFGKPDDPMAGFAAKVDMTDCTLVPVSHDGQFVGVCGLSGNPELDDRQTAALTLIVYALFAQVRSFRQFGIVTAPAQLTPREKEVITLSADGLTSSEIADQLGMSARTVNQHFDNVSSKLGTRNRAHTIAEAIRHNLL